MRIPLDSGACFVREREMRQVAARVVFEELLRVVVLVGALFSGEGATTTTTTTTTTTGGGGGGGGSIFVRRGRECRRKGKWVDRYHGDELCMCLGIFSTVGRLVVAHQDG